MVLFMRCGTRNCDSQRPANWLCAGFDSRCWAGGEAASGGAAARGPPAARVSLAGGRHGLAVAVRRRREQLKDVTVTVILARPMKRLSGEFK
jgi:hypothetical protein